MSKKKDLSPDWREMTDKNGEPFRLPPYVDANVYLDRGFSFANAKRSKSLVQKICKTFKD